jgi:hypothetical protein
MYKLRRAAFAATFGMIFTLSMMASPGKSAEEPVQTETVMTVQNFAPLYCFPMNMNDGNISWTHTATISGRNNYRYVVNEPQPARTGTTSCVADPKFVPGEYSADFQTCLYAGGAALVGSVIPGVGTVSAVYFFATTCGIAVLVN